LIELWNITQISQQISAYHVSTGFLTCHEVRFYC